MSVADDVTVAIVTRDRWDVVRRTLAALRAQTVTGFETIIVCDGADQQAPAEVRELPDVRVLVQEPAGSAAARNLAAGAGERRLLLLLGDDLLPGPGLVERHLARHGREEVAVLGSVSQHPEVPDSRLERWVAAAGRERFFNFSIERRLFLSLGGFDCDFLAGGEDLDFAWRLRERGVRIVYEPGAEALRLHGHDWASVGLDYENRARAERLMLAKHERFTPSLRPRIAAAAAAPPVSRAWPYLVDLVPRPARARVQARAERWYLQRLAPAFLSAWEGQRDLEELRDYLGEAYAHANLVHHGRMLDEEARAAGDEAGFYRTSEGYLYDLTVFAMSGTKDPYRRALCSLVAPGARLLDYGCGIGSDGLRLLEAGYRVSFADYENPSTRYLRWRLARRDLSASVYDLDDDVPGGFDAAYAFDVIEHVEDPFAFLAEMERRAAIVVVNLLESAPGDTALHRPLPLRAILAHAVRRGLLHYRRYHGRSHLIAYRSSVAALGGGARLRSLAELAVGAARRA